jgi:hypothetical protein
LQRFTVHVTAAGKETFAALREKDHDDLVPLAGVLKGCRSGFGYLWSDDNRLSAVAARMAELRHEQLATAYQLKKS